MNWPGPRRTRRRNGTEGFSLLEVLVGLIILTVGIALALGQVEGLYDYNFRARAHQRDVSSILNRAAELPLLAWDRAQVTVTADRVEVTQAGASAPFLFISNHAADELDVPVSQGFSPYQVYAVQGGKGRDLQLLLPGLSPAL